MKRYTRLLSLVVLSVIVLLLASCSQNAENEHLPDYCQTYTGFMEIASPDLYEKMGGINSRNYLTVISEISLEWEADDPYREIDLDGIQCFQNLTSLTLIGQSFKDISEISALKNIQQITLDSTSVVDISSFQNLSKVKELNITNTKTLQSVDGVEEMTKLESLSLTHNGIVNIDGLNQLTKLTSLDLSNNEIVFFPSIADLEYLTALNISNNQIEYLANDLSGLSNLETLVANNNKISDISSLDDLENLEILDLSFNDLGSLGGSPDFTSLNNATKLRQLYLNDNGLTSISGLADKSLPLEILHLQNNELNDLSPIADYTTIIDLQIYSNNITNIANLSGMENLTEINLSDNTIEDFSNLLSIPNLEFVYLQDNQIASIPEISSYWPNLNTLDLSRNVIQDTSGVEGHPSLKTLRLIDNGLWKLEGISNLPSFTTLDLFYNIDPETGDITDINPVTDEPYVNENINLIRVIENSYNNVPLMVLDDDGTLDFGFTLVEHGEIYSSFNDLNDVTGVVLNNMGIDIIDSNSFTSTEIGGFLLGGNNLTNIDFLRGNPALIYINLNDNPVVSYDILNGVTYADDFANLQQFHGSDNPVIVDFDGAFVGLTDLTIINLSNSKAGTIENSFVDLEQLVEFHIDGSSIDSINGSFNNMYQTYTPDNIIQFNGGSLTSIIGSFNGGYYEQIGIINQTPGTTDTLISGSFNNLVVSNVTSLIISNSHFKTIENSFDNTEVDNIQLMNNATETITNSFNGLDVSAELNLQNNELQTVDLSGITNVISLDVSNNALTTVSFIEAIEGLTTVDISNQQNTLDDSLSLTTIDGINNIPTLNSVVMSGLGLTSIDGFKNVALTEFSYTILDNNAIQINSISSDSFLHSPLESVNITGHQLSDISFLSLQENIDTLELTIDMLDLTPFTTMAFESNLEVLILESVQDINDYSVFEEYDYLTDFSISSTETVINNLDGLDRVQQLIINHADTITAINNSFNNFLYWAPNATYLENFTSLTAINTSFDLYDGVADSNIINLTSDYVITDSFNNVRTVNISSSGEAIPTFDATSFDNASTLSIGNSEYDSYAFLNNFNWLTSISINMTERDILDLRNDYVDRISLNNTDARDRIINVTTKEDAEINLFQFGDTLRTITLNTNSSQIDLSTQNRDIILNSSMIQTSVLDNPLVIIGESNNLVLSNNTLYSLEFDDFTSTNDITINADVLEEVSEEGSSTEAQTITVNSDTDTLSFPIQASVVTFNTPNLSTTALSVNTTTIDYVLNTDVASLSIDGVGRTLDLNAPNLTTFSGVASLTMNSATLTSTVLDDVDVLGTISFMTIESSVASLDVESTSSVIITVYNDGLTTLTGAYGNGTLNIETTNNQPFNLDLTGNIVNVVGENIPTINITSTSVMGILDLGVLNSINDVTFNNADIETVELETPQAIIDLTGQNVDTFIIHGDNVNDITLDSPTASLRLDTLVNILSADLNINSIDITTSNNLETINLTATSTIDTFTITNLALDQINTLGADIETMNINTTRSTLSIDGTNVDTLNVTVPNMTSGTLESVTSLTISGNTTSNPVVIDLDSQEIVLNTNSPDVTLLNTSSASDFEITSNQSLNTLDLGTASFASVEVKTPALSFNAIAQNTNSIQVIGNVNNLDLDVAPTTTVVADLNTNSQAIIDTSTTDIEITNNEDVSVTGDVLDTVAAEIGNNKLDITLTGLERPLTLEGSMQTVEFSGNMNAVEMSGITSLDEIISLNTGISSIDNTGFNLTHMSVITDETTFQLLGTNGVSDFEITGTNLSQVTANQSVTSITVFTEATTLDVDGNYTTVDLRGLSLTSINLDSLNYFNLIVDAQSLQSLDTLAVSGGANLELMVYQDDFNLTTQLSGLQFGGIPTYNVNISSNASDIAVNTGLKELSFNTPSTDVTVTNGPNLDQVNGTMSDLVVLESAAGVFRMDVNANNVSINDDSITTVVTNGVGTINTLFIDSQLVTSILTNDVTMNLLDVTASVNQAIDIDTLATSVNLANGITTNEATFTVRRDGQTYNSNVRTANFTTTGFSTGYIYNGTTSGVIIADDFNQLYLNATNANTLSVTANGITDLVIQSTILENLTLSTSTTNLVIFSGEYVELTTNVVSVTDTLTLDIGHTNLIGLEDLLNGVQTLQMDSLDPNQLVNIHQYLLNTGITLNSVDITNVALFNYLYNNNYAVSVSVENNTNTKENGLLETAATDALVVYRTNSFFDHLTDQEIKNDLKADTMGTTQDIFDGYAASLGLTEQEMIDDTENYGQTYVDNAKTSITSTLTDPNASIDFDEISTDLEALLVQEATDATQLEVDNKGYTINEVLLD